MKSTRSSRMVVSLVWVREPLRPSRPPRHDGWTGDESRTHRRQPKWRDAPLLSVPRQLVEIFGDLADKLRPGCPGQLAGVAQFDDRIHGIQVGEEPDVAVVDGPARGVGDPPGRLESDAVRIGEVDGTQRA